MLIIHLATKSADMDAFEFDFWTVLTPRGAETACSEKMRCFVKWLPEFITDCISGPGWRGGSSAGWTIEECLIKTGAGFPPFSRGWSRLATCRICGVGTGLGALRFLGMAGGIKIQSRSMSCVSMTSRIHENKLKAGDSATLGLAAEMKLTKVEYNAVPQVLKWYQSGFQGPCKGCSDGQQSTGWLYQ